MEQETVTLLSSIFASTGENFGITKTLQPFNNELLENLRVKSISFAWCKLSIWIMVTRYCRSAMCGLLHHIDKQNNYVTPALFLTDSGHLHIQMNGESPESTAFLSPFQVPLREWCWLTMELQGRAATVSMVCLEKEQRRVYSAQHSFGHNLVLDDTEGYFVVGGGKYVSGMEGYYGPVLFYRNRIPAHTESEVQLPDVISGVDLSGWLQSCQEFQNWMNVKIRGYLLKDKGSAEAESCVDIYHQNSVTYRPQSEPQCEDWEEVSAGRKTAAKVTKLLVLKRGGREVSVAAVGRALYLLSLHRLERATSTAAVSRILPLLLQAGCSADNRALYISAVLYSSGLGVERQYKKAWLLSLLAAQRDQRLALLRLAFMHHQGLHGFDKDQDLAYAYYANIAHQTETDRHVPSAQQTFVETVYLNDNEALKQQTGEDHHIFQWLKLQAQRGKADAEQAMGRMLFWGQQGVTPNIQKAVRHYHRGAVQHEDPVSMYDYGIVLLQGQGVKQDIPKAVTFLKKAMDKGSVPAMNALGWYYEQFEKDFKQAVRLWEQADLLESPDAALNLGVMYLQGQYPGKQADQYAAYEYFLKSARRGHLRGAIQVAEIWTTGIPAHVDRQPLDAVIWTKWAAEHNGYLGTVLRKGLDFYIKNNMLQSLLYYLMAAESGFAAAQFNVAYLCEQNSGNILDPAFVSSCMWKYYNLTIQSDSPNTYALIKMGDLLYKGQGRRQKDLFSAAHLYKEAALRNEPQGLYNLGLLAEEGYKLPLSVLTELGLSHLYLADKSVLLKALYQKCRDSEDTDSFLPCSLAHFSVYLQGLQKEYSAAIMYSTALATVVAFSLYFILLSRLRGRVFSFNY